MKQVIAAALMAHANMVCQRIIDRWSRMVGIVGNADIVTELPVIVGNAIFLQMQASGQKAWMAEFGSGSQADKGNPYLDNYVLQSNFNRYRSKSDMTLRGRDAGEYSDLDGNVQASHGSAAGRDLEAKPVYSTMYPAHVIQEEVDNATPELLATLNSLAEKYMLQQLSLTTEMYM